MSAQCARCRNVRCTCRRETPAPIQLDPKPNADLASAFFHVCVNPDETATDLYRCPPATIVLAAEPLAEQTEPDITILNRLARLAGLEPAQSPPPGNDDGSSLPPLYPDSSVAAVTDRFNLDDILSSDADALVLGDASDIVSSTTWVGPVPVDLDQIRSPSGDHSAMAPPTETNPRAQLRVFLGGDLVAQLAPPVVLRRRSESRGDSALAGLSPFEHFVLQRIDGMRTIADVQTAMRISDGDLRIVLALLLDKQLIEASAPQFGALPATVADVPSPTPSFTQAPRPFTLPPAASPAASPTPPVPWPRLMTPPPQPSATFTPAFGPAPAGISALPAFALSPAKPGSLPPTPTPRPTPTPMAAPLPGTLGPRVPTPHPASLRTGLLIAGNHATAAACHSQCIRELKNGGIERAWQLAVEAQNAAPDVALYKDTLAEWATFVASHRTADDVRFKAQAITAEELGDFDKAVLLLRQATAANPTNASAWNRLAILLATKKADIDGAMDAAQKAVALMPNDATYLSNLSKFASIAERGDKKGRGVWNRLRGK